ncbi:MAG TPA: hypothetical protein VLD35_12790 [Caldimonas sp.]|nr:hypothetical protein [Caldimonas sp.]
MKALDRRACIALLALLPWQSSFAQRMVGGGLNYAPVPAVYTVVSFDRESRKVRLRAADGRTGDVFFPQDVFDLSKLKAGDLIRVDFVAPDKSTKGLTAASAWPVK